MANRILIDTNVLLDYLLTREPFYEDARNIVITCTDGNIKGCIAAHSISNIFYIFKERLQHKGTKSSIVGFVFNLRC